MKRIKKADNSSLFDFNSIHHAQLRLCVNIIHSHNRTKVNKKSLHELTHTVEKDYDIEIMQRETERMKSGRGCHFVVEFSNFPSQRRLENILAWKISFWRLFKIHKKNLLNSHSSIIGSETNKSS